jgi:hypothetical protein
MAEQVASAADDDRLSTDPDEIQFDQAEFTVEVPGGPTCVGCRQAITDEYYELVGNVFCSPCRQRVEKSWRSGSRLARAFKALIFGSVAGVIGAAIYYVTLRAGWNIGLIAVLVGLMVGGAVRRGAGNRGGLFYQVLAVFLTYTAIGAMHVPLVLLKPDEPAEVKQPAAKATGSARKAPGNASAKRPAPAKAAHDQARPLPDIPPNPFANAPNAAGGPEAGPANDGKNAVAVPEVKLVDPVVFGFVHLLLFIVYAGPLVHLYMEPLSGLIFGFAIWEAWKINKRAQLAFSGPFRLSMNGSNHSEPEGIDDAE